MTEPGEYAESFLLRQLLAYEAALRVTLEQPKSLDPVILEGLRRQTEGLVAHTGELSLALNDVRAMRACLRSQAPADPE